MMSINKISAIFLVMFFLLILASCIGLVTELLDHAVWNYANRVFPADKMAASRTAFSIYFIAFFLFIFLLSSLVPLFFIPFSVPYVAYFFVISLLTIFLIISLYANLYEALGLIDDRHITHDETTAVYFSIVTFTTLGYGDIVPSREARMWAASEALVGSVLMAIFIGLVVFHLQLLRTRLERTDKSPRF